MKANEKRFLSFLVILVVYVIATVAGIAIYKYLDESIPFYWRLLVADVIATIITFVFSVIFKNSVHIRSIAEAVKIAHAVNAHQHSVLINCSFHIN